MSARSKARKRALDILFESELRSRNPMETLTERIADADPPVRLFTRELIEGFVAHADEIDRRIVTAMSGGWSLPRMPRVDRNTVRLAVLEIDYLDVPDSVAVSEALTLVTDLSTDDSPAYVNGLLGTIVATKPAPAPTSDAGQ